MNIKPQKPSYYGQYWLGRQPSSIPYDVKMNKISWYTRLCVLKALPIWRSVLWYTFKRNKRLIYEKISWSNLFFSVCRLFCIVFVLETLYLLEFQLKKKSAEVWRILKVTSNVRIELFREIIWTFSRNPRNLVMPKPGWVSATDKPLPHFRLGCQY